MGFAGISLSSSYSKFYKGIKGVVMGNLSTFLSDSFIGRNEDDLHSKGLLPEIRTRHVDEIFNIVHKDKMKEIPGVVNMAHRKFRFTVETEVVSNRIHVYRLRE